MVRYALNTGTAPPLPSTYNLTHGVFMAEFNFMEKSVMEVCYALFCVEMWQQCIMLKYIYLLNGIITNIE